MKRLTTDNVSEMNMTELALNQVYIADGRAWYRNGPEDGLSVCDLIRNAAETLGVELPILSDDDLSSLLADWMQYGVEEPEGVLAILYRALWAGAELRGRLKQYEDIGLGPDEITVDKPACTFYCNRRCNLDGDWCPEGPGCSWELSPEEAVALISPPNPPLTLSELREMDGEPVWVTSTNNDRERSWMLVDRKYEMCREVHGGLAIFENYGKTWLAYRRKPEDGTK